jgi:hypothetical protein
MEDFLATYDLFETGESLGIVDAPLPADLIALLTQVGASSYANGFFRFVAPESMRDYCALFNLKPEECYPFLKLAFGHLVFYHDEQYKLLDPVFNNIDSLGEKDELDFVMDIALCDRPALENTFMIDVYEQAFPDLGAPKLDEIYAFVPALGLGGDRLATNVKRSLMAVEMNILSQL